MGTDGMSAPFRPEVAVIRDRRVRVSLDLQRTDEARWRRLSGQNYLSDEFKVPLHEFLPFLSVGMPFVPAAGGCGPEGSPVSHAAGAPRSERRAQVDMAFPDPRHPELN